MAKSLLFPLHATNQLLDGLPTRETHPPEMMDSPCWRSQQAGDEWQLDGLKAQVQARSVASVLLFVGLEI